MGEAQVSLYRCFVRFPLIPIAKFEIYLYIAHFYYKTTSFYKIFVKTQQVCKGSFGAKFKILRFRMDKNFATV